jgi:hypothetical protein
MDIYDVINSFISTFHINIDEYTKLIDDLEPIKTLELGDMYYLNDGSEYYVRHHIDILKEINDRIEEIFDVNFVLFVKQIDFDLF